MNNTVAFTRPSAGTASHAAAVTLNAGTGRTWALPATRTGLAMAVKPTNPRPLSPPEWLSP